MDVTEIAPGLWRWTAYHEEAEEDVGSIYYETADGVVLIDPLVPPEDRDRFLSALDRDVARAGGDVHVLVTIFWHARSAAELVERYSARVWAATGGRAAVARRAGVVTDPFRPGDRLPGGIAAFETARRGEVVYWLPEQRAVVPGDALIGDGAGGVEMCPESWLRGGRTHADLASTLRPLLELPIEHVLLSHGEPVLGDGRAALAEAIG